MDKLQQSERISYSQGRKINLGNFESLDFHYSYSADIDPRLDVEDFKKYVQGVVSVWCDQREKEIKKQLKPVSSEMEGRENVQQTTEPRPQGRNMAKEIKTGHGLL